MKGLQDDFKINALRSVLTSSVFGASAAEGRSFGSSAFIFSNSLQLFTTVPNSRYTMQQLQPLQPSLPLPFPSSHPLFRLFALSIVQIEANLSKYHTSKGGVLFDAFCLCTVPLRSHFPACCQLQNRYIKQIGFSLQWHFLVKKKPEITHT